MKIPLKYLFLEGIKVIFIFILYGLFIYFLASAGFPAHRLFILIVVTGILLGLSVKLLISKPVIEIEQKIKKVASGNFEIHLDTVAGDEFYSLKNSLNRMIDGFSSLLRIAQLLNTEKNLDKLLNIIITETSKLLHAERSTLFIYNEERDELWSYIAQELEIKEIRLRSGQGIAGYVAKTGMMVNIQDAYNDSRFDRNIDKITGFKTRNILCAPLFNQSGKLLGVLQVLNKINGSFTEYDESLLKAIVPQSAIAIENAQLYSAQENLLKSLIKTLVATIDARDPVTSGHSERVSRYCVAIGKKLNLDENELKILEYSSLLHDVGKIGIKDDILSKPGQFSEEEYSIIKKHPVITKEILEKVYFTGEQKQIPTLAAIHHEKLDGTGYPFGLKTDSIPLLARIIAVADVYDAIVSYDRPYKPALPVEEALKVLKSEAEKNKFDKQIVKLFIENKLYELEKKEKVQITPELMLEYRPILPEEIRNIIPIVSRGVDTGRSGLSFETKDALMPNTFIEVRIHLPGFTVDSLARVVSREIHNSGYKIYINFINLGEEAKKRLKKYMIDLKFYEKEVLKSGN